MKIISLFAGTRSWDKVAIEMGHECFSVDNVQYGDIDLVQDIRSLQKSQLPPSPDLILASPPCTSYSKLGYSHHRESITGAPKTEEAREGERLVITTLIPIRLYLKENPNLIYAIENPEGHLNKSTFHTTPIPGRIMAGIPLGRVNYCQYGWRFFKPTHIWTNNLRSVINPVGWSPRPLCFRGNLDCRHEKTRSGSATVRGAGNKVGGFQQYISSRGGPKDHDRGMERSRMPPELCKEIISAAAATLRYRETGDKYGQRSCTDS